MNALFELVISSEKFGVCSTDITMTQRKVLPFTPAPGLIVTDIDDEYVVDRVSYDLETGQLFVYLDIQRVGNKLEQDELVAQLNKAGWLVTI